MIQECEAHVRHRPPCSGLAVTLLAAPASAATVPATSVSMVMDGAANGCNVPVNLAVITVD